MKYVVVNPFVIHPFSFDVGDVVEEIELRGWLDVVGASVVPFEEKSPSQPSNEPERESR